MSWGMHSLTMLSSTPSSFLVSWRSRKPRKIVGFPPKITVRVPSPGDITCNWHPENLFVHKKARASGFRFPVHPFVARLLAEAKVNPCQLYPNSWKFIFIFMVRCHKEGIPLNIPLFRSIFMFKNRQTALWQGKVGSLFSIARVFITLWMHPPFLSPFTTGNMTLSFSVGKEVIGDDISEQVSTMLWIQDHSS